MKKQASLASFAGALLLGLVVALLNQPAQGDEPAAIDWSVWQKLPLFEDGRIKPMDTFARRVVEKITGRPNPTLAPPAGASSNEAVQKLFPEGRPRTWSAPELVFSWLVEPEKWENIPFLAATHETLRSELLEVPLTDESGHRLKYVTPQDVERSIAFENYLRDLSRRRKEVEDRGGRFRMTGLDLHVARLWDAYATYRLLTFIPRPDSRVGFPPPIKVVHPVPRRLERLVDLWQSVQPQITQLAEMGALRLGAETGSAESTDESARESKESPQFVEEVAKEFAALGNSIDTISVGELDRRVASLQPKVRRIAMEVESLRHRAFQVNVRSDGDAQRLDSLRSQLRLLASRVHDVAQELEALEPMIYDTGSVPNVLPAMIPACLSTETQTGEPVSPWLSLWAVLYGSPDVLRGYDMGKVNQARQWFEKAAAAYRSHDPAQADNVSQSLAQFAAILGDLGRSIESERRNLPVDEAHRDLLAQTAYPPPGYTNLEVFYNAFDPFHWAWITNLCAFGILLIGIGRARRVSLFVGLGVLVLAQIITAVGFGMRVAISGWAPVTNMFESIVFVSFVIGILGIWFVVQPVLGEAVRRAWSFVSLPFEPLVHVTPDEKLGSGASGKTIKAAIFAGRLILGGMLFYYLAVVPYDVGKSRAVFDLVPEITRSLGSPSLASVLMNVLGWLVGICILLCIVWLVPRFCATVAVAAVSTIPAAFRGPDLRGKVDHAVQRSPFALAAAGLAFLTTVIAYFSPVWDKGIEALQPVLRDRLWLFAHVLTVTAGYGAGLLAWGIGNIALGYYLFGRYQYLKPGERRLKGERHRAQGGTATTATFVEAPEPCYTLAQYIYKCVQVAVILLTAGTILGGVWADRAWGRFWGWDPKEVWALISILVYMALLHGRYAGWVNTFGMAAGSVFGMISVVWAWYGTNFLMPAGLHAYAGEGSGGGLYVVAAFTANLVFVGLAWVRYRRETYRGEAMPQTRIPSAGEQQRTPNQVGAVS
ncbi:cytochrome c biogenesis protein CcsA [Thermogutta sp.]|uniref:cytochrome c biogenesis protein n=2 Tax=Thermogutta sp. TaxID=1962930 RepID=UPI00321F9D85